MKKIFFMTLVLIFAITVSFLVNLHANQKEQLSVRLPSSNERINVNLDIPTEWKKGAKATLTLKTQPDEWIPTNLYVSAECNGLCEPSAIKKNMDEAMKGLVEKHKKPNVNTGRPELDAVRANIEMVENNKLTNVYIQAFRVTYSKDIPDPNMHKPWFVVGCFYYKEGSKYFIRADLRAPLSAESKVWPAAKEICQTLTF